MTCSYSEKAATLIMKISQRIPNMHQLVHTLAPLRDRHLSFSFQWDLLCTAEVGKVFLPPSKGNFLGQCLCYYDLLWKPPKNPSSPKKLSKMGDRYLVDAEKSNSNLLKFCKAQACRSERTLTLWNLSAWQEIEWFHLVNERGKQPRQAFWEKSIKKHGKGTRTKEVVLRLKLNSYRLEDSWIWKH